MDVRKNILVFLFSALRLSYVTKVNEEEASYEQGQAENTSIPGLYTTDFIVNISYIRLEIFFK